MAKDIRVRVTKSIIKDALHAIIQEHSMKYTSQSVSVRELCERAGISRPTFYTHYRDIYDLIAEDEQDMLRNLRIERLSAGIPANMDKEELLLSVLKYLNDNERIYRYYFSVTGHEFLEVVLQDVLKKVISEIRLRREIEDDLQLELFVRYRASGLVTLFQKWIEYGPNKPCSIEEYAHRIALAMEGKDI